MKIKEGSKYRVLIEYHHFGTENSGKLDDSFMLFPGDIYPVENVYEKNGAGFVSLGAFENQYGEMVSRTVNIAIFAHCFEEVVKT